MANGGRIYMHTARFRWQLAHQFRLQSILEAHKCKCIWRFCFLDGRRSGGVNHPGSRFASFVRARGCEVELQFKSVVAPLFPFPFGIKVVFPFPSG